MSLTRRGFFSRLLGGAVVAVTARYLPALLSKAEVVEEAVAFTGGYVDPNPWLSRELQCVIVNPNVLRALRGTVITGDLARAFGIAPSVLVQTDSDMFARDLYRVQRETFLPAILFPDYETPT